MLTGAHVHENSSASDRGPLPMEMLRRAMQAGATNEFFIRSSNSTANAKGLAK
jgi:hypothetical protein